MEVAKYVFQSRYSSPFQLGRLDTQTADKEAKTELGNKVPVVKEQGVTAAKNSVSQVTSSSSVNLSQSSKESGLSDSLKNFTTINNQTKAVQAYSS